ncbi:hypothetical protein CMI48_03320 [Candidatus Pacearchaeota archaeon]|nr:hypothetical protein [Candidatus Pacearchaeota archaeon]
MVDCPDWESYDGDRRLAWGEYKRKNAQLQKYNLFFDHAVNHGVRTDQFGMDTEVKREGLQSFFPKFAFGGSQDVSDLGDVDVGYLYRDVMMQARRVLGS